MARSGHYVLAQLDNWWAATERCSPTLEAASLAEMTSAGTLLALVIRDFWSRDFLAMKQRAAGDLRWGLGMRDS